MKKSIAVLLVLALTLSFAACGTSKPAESAATTTDTAATTTATTTAATTTETTPASTIVTGEDGYGTICEYNGAVISWKPELEMSENGDLQIEITVDASRCPDNLAVALANCTVNGFGVSTPTQFMVRAGDNNGMTLSIWTSAMAGYGLANYADVKAGLAVYKFDPETYDIITPAVAEVAPMTLTTGMTGSDTRITTPEAPIFDRDGVKIYAIQVEEAIYSRLDFYVVNETGKAVTVTPRDLVMNGEPQQADYSDYSIPVSANGSTFAAIPLPNYTYDEATGAATKIEITGYSFDFDVREK